MRILRENCTGLVIDIQDKLLPVIADNEVLCTNCVKLIEGLQLLNIPLAVTQQYTKGLGATNEKITSLFNDFSFFEKRSFSCLDDPTYTAYLKQSEKMNVVICGIESHVCVLQTALDLKEQGFEPIVVADCVGSRNPCEKQIALQRLALEGIRVSTAESLLFELTRSSQAMEFRAISKLVK